MRNLKAFGLAVVAIFVMGTIAASPASANQLHFWLTKVTVASNATQTFEYETLGQTVECSTVAGSGEATSTVSEITFTPTYSSCKAPGIGFSSVEVLFNGCDYLFTIEAAANNGSVHLKCPEGKQIALTIKVFGFSVCTLHIGEQTPSGVADYTNSESTKVNVQPTQTGIAASMEGSPECGEATSTTGSYTGQVQAKSEITGQSIEIPIQVS